MARMVSTKQHHLYLFTPTPKNENSSSSTKNATHACCFVCRGAPQRSLSLACHVLRRGVAVVWPQNPLKIAWEYNFYTIHFDRFLV